MTQISMIYYDKISENHHLNISAFLVCKFKLLPGVTNLSVLSGFRLHYSAASLPSFYPVLY